MRRADEVHDCVGRHNSRRKRRCVERITIDRRHPGRQPTGGGGPNQRAHAVTACCKRVDEAPADVARSPGNKNVAWNRPDSTLARMKPRVCRLFASAIAVALRCAAVSVEAQSRRGGFGFGARTASAKDFDGSFHFCRIVFRNSIQGDGGGWSVDYPRPDINFSMRLSELTKTHVSRDNT